MSLTRTTGLAWASLLGVAISLLGCAPPQRPVSQTRLYATDQMGGAKSCAVPKLAAPVAGKEVAVPMTVGNDGGWCAISIDDNGHPFTAGLLSARPAHGRVYVHSVGDATRIDYTPESGYVGSDAFSVRLLPGDGVVNATVTVTAATVTK